MNLLTGWFAANKGRRRTPRLRIIAAALWSVISFAGLGYPAGAATKNSAPSGPQPVVRIPLSGLGYRPQNPSSVSARLSASSLDFIDQDHLLVTFRDAILMKRLADAKPDDEDQTIRAVVLDIASAQVVKTAEWRMHDHARYLWALGQGRFLVRQRDTLFLTDAGLELRPYLDSPARLESIEPTPDGKLLAIEVDQERHTAEEHRRLLQQALDLGDSPPREDVKIAVMRADDGAILATSHANRAVNLALLGDSYMEVIPKKEDHWQLSRVPFSGTAKVFGDVKSSCAPTEQVVTPALMLLMTCNSHTPDRLVQGLDRDGKILWSLWWESTFIWPSFAGAQDGSDFAFSTLHSTHAVNALDPVTDEDIQGQRVQVFDAATGAMQLSVNIVPATASEANYALSPDGKRLAVLSGRAVEIYNVPPAPPAPGPR